MSLRSIKDTENPDMNKPDRPVKKKESVDQDSEDPESEMEYEEYIKDMKEFRLQIGHWEENQPRMYNLVLQHYPPKLETCLITQQTWE